MSIDLVYILGKGSKWGNNELRYSLRSAIENFKFDRVFIIGEKPDWIHNVIHIPVKDNFNNKIQNAVAKYLVAANTEDISEDFVLMNDDFFFLKPIDDIPYYSRGTSKQMIKEHRTKGGYYFDSIKKTKYRLEQDDFDGEVMDFEVHSPIVFNKKKLKQVIESVDDKTICLFRTYYCNWYKMRYNIIRDFKVTNSKDFNKELKEGREFMSISDAAVMLSSFRQWIQTKFGKVSKYENDDGSGINVQPGVSFEYMAYHATQRFAHGGKQFNKGELIDMRTMKSLKNIPNLRHLWILK